MITRKSSFRLAATIVCFAAILWTAAACGDDTNSSVKEKTETTEPIEQGTVETTTPTPEPIEQDTVETTTPTPEPVEEDDTAEAAAPTTEPVEEDDTVEAATPTTEPVKEDDTAEAATPTSEPTEDDAPETDSSSMQRTAAETFDWSVYPQVLGFCRCHRGYETPIIDLNGYDQDSCREDLREEERTMTTETDEERRERLAAERARMQDVLDRHEALFYRQPGWIGHGVSQLLDVDGEPTKQRGITIEVLKKIDQRTLPVEDRIPDCIEGVPVQIVEDVANDELVSLPGQEEANDSD